MIYTIIMFHNSIPHVHGEANVANVKHQQEHHHHYSNHAGHHHHEESKKESSFLSLLLGLFGDHHNALETDHFDEDILLKFNSNAGLEMASSEEDIDYPIFHLKFNENDCSSQRKYIFEPPPLLYELSKNSTTKLRGPPQLS